MSGIKTIIMKKIKITYWTSTVLLSMLMLMSASMYLFKTEDVTKVFESLGYPAYLLYPLAAAKIAAVVVLLTSKQSTLKEWAYAGLFFDFVLAFFAHVAISDGEQFGAVVALILLATSYFSGKKLFNTNI